MANIEAFETDGTPWAPRIEFDAVIARERHESARHTKISGLAALPGVVLLDAAVNLHEQNGFWQETGAMFAGAYAIGALVISGWRLKEGFQEFRHARRDQQFAAVLDKSV